MNNAKFLYESGSDMASMLDINRTYDYNMLHASLQGKQIEEYKQRQFQINMDRRSLPKHITNSGEYQSISNLT